MVASDLPLTVDHLNKRYGSGPYANRDISFAAHPGEMLGILGPNGAGKTTLVRQTTTELLSTSGSIHVFGLDMVSDPIGAKNLMGVVPQEAQLFELLTVYETLKIFAKLRGLSSRDASSRAKELLTVLRLAEYYDVTTVRLSGGLKRRVMVGISMIARPGLIVLDEPTTGLDPQSRRDMWDLMRDYKDRGATILMTTHYMEEAEALCDRVGIISQGRLLALDTVSNLRSSRGFDFKITYTSDGLNAATQTIFGTNDRELVERVRQMGIRQYSVGRTTLEDVYLALTDEEERHGRSSSN